VSGVVLVVAGCGGQTSDGGGQAGPVDSVPPATGTHEPAAPPPMPDETPVPSVEPSVVTPVAGSARRTTPWRLVQVERSGVLLEVQVGGPPCDVVTAVEVAESAREVTVTVRAGAERGARCGPGEIARLGTVWVRATFAEPLGGRRLVDGGR
jgi:hypothetical protein